MEVALGGELAVGLGDDPARDPELSGERPARREPGAGGEAAGADVVAQGPLDLLVERDLVLAVEPEEEFRAAANWPIR